MKRWMAVLMMAAAAQTAAVAQTPAEDFFRPITIKGDAENGYRDTPVFQYTVQQGETLFTIAKRLLGDPYQGQLLAKLNDIADPLEIAAGTRIKVPRPHLGILYSIQVRSGDCDLAEVSDQHLFSAGDRFQLRVSANVDGYLYVYNRAPNGDLVRLVPDPGKPMKIRRFSEYLLPRNDWFRFDGARGPEELLVLVSLDPLSELDGDLTAGAARDKVAALVKNAAGRQTVAGEGQNGRGRSYVSFSPIDNTTVLAHRIVLRKK